MNLPKHYRVGQIVPSSNVTMETEVPAMLSRAQVPEGVTFSCHSSRAPMKTVSKEELTAMNGHMVRCAGELVDARMDVITSACLVAIMCQGAGYHRETETSLAKVCETDLPDTPIVTSAGALISALHAIKAKRISLIAPYMKPLTAQVVAYIQTEGIEVVDSISLEVADNLAVGVRQGVSFADIGGNDAWNGSTRVGMDYFLNVGRCKPFAGVNIGYLYGDSVEEQFIAGPDVGMRYFLNDTTFINLVMEYQFLFEDAGDAKDSYDDGRFVYALGMGVKW